MEDARKAKDFPSPATFISCFGSWRKALAVAVRIHKPCVDCGADISERRNTARRCVSCQKKHSAIRANKWRDANPEEYQRKATIAHRAWLARHPGYLTKYNREYRIKNRDVIVKREKEWGKTPRGREVNLIKCSKRRARQAGVGGEFDARDARRLKGVYTVCVYCGEKRGLEVEHVIPLDRGGRNDITNMVMACKACNSGKRSTPIKRWFREYPEKKAHFYSMVREEIIIDKKTGKRRVLYLPI